MRVVAFGGGHGLSASLRALLRCVPRTSTWRSPRSSRSATTAARAGGCAPNGTRCSRPVTCARRWPRWPPTTRAPSAPRDLLQHRFAAMPAADRPTAGRPRGRQPAAARPDGDARRPGRRPRPRRPACSAPRGRVLPMAAGAGRHRGRRARRRPGAARRGGHRARSARRRGRRPATSRRYASRRPTRRPAPRRSPPIEAADWLIFGPGCWYTSVLPHLLVPGLAAAIIASPARRLVTLNLAADNETHGLSVADHLAALHWYLPDLRVDVVLADAKVVGEPEPVHRAAESLGAQLVLAPLAVADGSPRHDPESLARCTGASIGRRSLSRRRTTAHTVQDPAHEVTTRWR